MQTKSRTQAFSPQCLSLAVLTQGGRPGKTESRGMMYLDVWRSGTFLLYSCKAAFWIQETSPRLSDVECSVILRSVFAIGSALAYLLFFQECATPPHVQVRHTTWLSSTRPSPALVLQATNAGSRKPGYEATVGPCNLFYKRPLKIAPPTLRHTTCTLVTLSKEQFPLWEGRCPLWSCQMSSCQMSYSCLHTSIAHHATIPQGAGQGLHTHGIINIP